MDKTYNPSAPFQLWHRQWFDSDLGYCWITVDPPVLVTQSVGTEASVASVTYIQDFLDECVTLGFPERYPGTIILHDWRTLQTPVPESRAVWAARAQRPGNPFSGTSSYVATMKSSLVRMNLQVGALSLQLSSGAPAVQLIDDPAPLLAKLGIKPPPFGLLAYLRSRS